MHWTGFKGVEGQGATEGKFWRFWAQEKWKEIRDFYNYCIHAILSSVITVATIRTSLLLLMLVLYELTYVWCKLQQVTCWLLTYCVFVGFDYYTHLLVLWVWHRLVRVIIMAWLSNFNYLFYYSLVSPKSITNFVFGFYCVHLF